MSRYCNICRNTSCLNHGTDTTLVGGDWGCNYIPVPTNADHIRAMSDEELAEWIRNGISSDACDYCPHNDFHCNGVPCHGKAEAEKIIDWLQQPYEEDA